MVLFLDNIFRLRYETSEPYSAGHDGDGPGKHCLHLPPCLGPPGTAENGDRGANTDKRWRRRKRKEDKHMMEGRETDWGWFLSPIVSWVDGNWKGRRGREARVRFPSVSPSLCHSFGKPLQLSKMQWKEKKWKKKSPPPPPLLSSAFGSASNNDALGNRRHPIQWAKTYVAARETLARRALLKIPCFALQVFRRECLPFAPLSCVLRSDVCRTTVRTLRSTMPVNMGMHITRGLLTKLRIYTAVIRICQAKTQTAQGRTGKSIHGMNVSRNRKECFGF